MSWYCPDENRDTTLVVVTNDNYDENHAFFFNQFEFPEEPEFSEAEPDVDDDNYDFYRDHGPPTGHFNDEQYDGDDYYDIEDQYDDDYY
jgi:hypothetical protein